MQTYDLPKFRASGAVHLMGICFIPSETMYSSSSLDIPKSEILTMHSYPKEIMYSTLYFILLLSLNSSSSNLVSSPFPFHLEMQFIYLQGSCERLNLYGCNTQIPSSSYQPQHPCTYAVAPVVLLYQHSSANT